MSGRGMHFAISYDQAMNLLKCKSDEDLVSLVTEEIEEVANEDNSFETDKAWDPIHRCLSNGTLDVRQGTRPLNMAIFGGRILNQGQDYFVVLLTPTEVKQVADALGAVTEDWMQKKYFDQKFPDYQGEKSQEDWEYAWGSFDGLPQFFANAAARKQHVIFTVAP
ncbi:MAG: YfbM family protein [Planctomycetaceae bacterium]|nr:YfbM family protein [Planctomycetaceae bacterium]